MIRFIALSLAVFVVSAFAGEGSFNYYGQLGFHKTQSAQTLGHGRIGFGLFAEGGNLHSLIEERTAANPNDDEEIRKGHICAPTPNEIYGSCNYNNLIGLGDSYFGGNAYLFLSFGLFEYFDLGISFPGYFEIIGVENRKNGDNCVVGDCPENIDAAGQGNLQFLAKGRLPFDWPVDIALILGATISTGRTDYHGLWIRDPAYLKIEDEYPIVEGASAYTNGGTMFKFGSAVTLDFNKLSLDIPLLFHLNWMYRWTGPAYPQVHSFAAALEWTPVKYISLMTEYYTDILSAFPKVDGEEGFAGTTTFTLGTAVHFNKNVDLQLGFQMLMGDDGKYIKNLAIPMNGKTENGEIRYGTYNAALVPKYLVYGGLTFKIFVIESEKEEEEEEKENRNPDTDGDGVCDPWVSRESRQREYSRTCKGIDLCPYEEGEIANKGCPEEEEGEEDAPVIKLDVNNESISAGQSATLIWIVSNADEVSIDQGIGEVDSEGRKRVKPTETTKYTITATGPGGTKTKSIEVVVESAAGPSIEFSASSESIQKGQPVTLTWMVAEATEVNIEGIGKVKNSGSRTVKPSATGVTTFTLTATGPGGTKTEAVEVEVLGGPLPTILFNISSESIVNGQTITLSWQVSNATEVTIEGLGKVPAKGTKKLKPVETTEYKLIATGEGGTETATVEVEVEEPPPAPTIEAKVNLKGVTFGSGNAALTPNAKTVLDGIAEQLLSYPKVKIEIHGYTDNQGNPKTNLDLSERRARAVVGYLAIRGVKMSRMSAIGFGQDNPIADNKTKEGRELNRRIEMIRVDD